MKHLLIALCLFPLTASAQTVPKPIPIGPGSQNKAPILLSPETATPESLQNVTKYLTMEIEHLTAKIAFDKAQLAKLQALQK